LLILFSQYKKITLVFLTFGLIIILVVPITRNRVLPIFQGADPASSERIKLYKGSFEIIKQNPILGSGLYGFRNAYQEIRESENDEILNYPHNFFLNFWIETGLLGLLAILAMLVWTYKFGKNLYTNNKDAQPLILAVFAGLVVILVHGQVDASFFKNDLAILFWFLLALLPAIAMFIPPPTDKPKY
jgi:O-antigen ligase